jgi:CRISPR-associated endonuclease Csn1
MKISMGLDLGVGSVGWALVELDDNNIPVRIIDCGSYVFNQLQDPKSGKLENQARREKRA